MVRWRTIGKSTRWGLSFGGSGGADDGELRNADSTEFTGIFVFEFEQEGRIISHIIEHVQEGGD